MQNASVVFGKLKPAGSEERLEQPWNMQNVLVVFGQLKPAGSEERLEQPLNIPYASTICVKSTEHSLSRVLFA